MINRLVNFSKRYLNITRNINLENMPLRGHFEQMFRETKPTQLGRWGLLHDERVNSRIDRSNTDNCGPCGYEAISYKKF